ncbi:type I-E CRISPR-associated endonuclease Cas1e [Propionibacteriaceae bacterium G57]|uniref:type I-E CRISPR-associated endonuclease Cas1e n=1 Tax=Aestuariimicrobium sp. G57 TaxID=3418485 RepID=UPI003DA77542
MKPIPGPRPSELRELTRVEDRVTFVYLERCRIHRDDNAITAVDEAGTLYFPAATVAALMLGPGTDISHQAMVVLADAGATVVWVGEEAVRYYAHGRPLSRTSRLLTAQVDAVSNQRSRLAVARRMYEMRFPDDVAESATMQQLRGREGARVKRGYRTAARDAGVEWNGREYRSGDLEASDAANQAVTAATSCLYGVVHAVVVALGCSPGLGFIHTGHDRSFVYDIADLYKMELAVPTAFSVVAQNPADLPSAVRLAMRDRFSETKLMTTIVRDIRGLLGDDVDDRDWDVVELWDGGHNTVAAGRSWIPEDDDLPW